MAVAQDLPVDAPARHGQAVFTAQCMPCHRMKGAGVGELGPDLGQPMGPTQYFQPNALRKLILDAAGRESTDFLDATRLATALIGDSIATNPFMLGYACQKGLLPVSLAALERAIELNAVAVEANLSAFLWGRRAAHDLVAVERYLAEIAPESMLVIGNCPLRSLLTSMTTFSTSPSSLIVP